MMWRNQWGCNMVPIHFEKQLGSFLKSQTWSYMSQQFNSWIFTDSREIFKEVLYVNFHSSIIHNSWILEIIQTSTNQYRDKQNVVKPVNGTLPKKKKNHGCSPTRVNPKNIMLSESSHTWKSARYKVPSLGNLWKRQIHRQPLSHGAQLLASSLPRARCGRDLL